MNPVLLASASAEMTANAAQEIAPGQVTHSGTTQTFSLPQQTQTAAVEVIRGAKVAHQQATDAAKKNDDTDPAAMQALLAMLLSQQQAQTPAQAETGVVQNNGVLQKLAAATAGSANGQSPVLRQLAESLARAANSSTDSDAAGQGASSDLSQFSPKLQGLLASLTQQDSAQTPKQQASLAKFSAEDLRAIAPAQPTVSDRVAARTKTEGNGVVRSAIARKNEGGVVPSGPTSAMTASTAAMQLHAVTLNNLQATQTNGQDFKLTHSTLPVDTQADEWGDKLTTLLKDRIQFQLNQQQQISTIRLDPPSLGKLEIAVQLDSGKLMVHIGANQSDVLHSLQQFSDDLRQHLTQQNFMEVNVQVSSEGQSQQQQQQPGHQQDEVMSALALNDEPQYQQNESVLIKV